MWIIWQKIQVKNNKLLDYFEDDIIFQTAKSLRQSRKKAIKYFFTGILLSYIYLYNPTLYS